MGRLRIDRLCDLPRPLVRDDGALVVARCYTATRGLARLVGLLGTGDLSSDEALFIPRCGSIHTVGMRRSIDVAFLDGDGRVLRVATVRPWRVLAARGARAVAETGAGGLADVRAGARLSVGVLRS